MIVRHLWKPLPAYPALSASLGYVISPYRNATGESERVDSEVILTMDTYQARMAEANSLGERIRKFR